jgi:anti-sigma B factor antagonist
VDGDKPVLRVLEGTRDDGTLVLCLQGDIDMATVGTLALHLDHIGDRARSVLVDLRRAGFLDCLGLRVLVDAHRDASARGDDIEFTQGPPAVRRMFELTGTLGLLPFAETA